MNLLRPASIRQRLLLMSTVITLLTLLIAATLFVVNDVRMLHGQMTRDLEVLSEVVGDSCISALVFDAPETAEKNLASLRREYQIRYAVLYDAGGRRFASYQRDPGQVLRDPVAPGESVHLDFSLTDPGTIEVVRDLALDGEPVGRIFIHARMDELAAQLRRYAWTVTILFAGTLFVSLLLAFRLQRRVSEPIRGLAGSMREISERGDYALRVEPPAGADEIAELFRGFNVMLGQIEGRDLALNRVRRDLEEANAKLRQLAMEIALVGEHEKKRLAGELHDSPMQKLALAQAQIVSASRRRDSESDRLLDVGLELMRDALQELRTLQFELSPPVLYQEGLAPALGWLASSVTQRFGIDMSFVEGESPPAVGQDLAVVLFQCARELVHNVVKHAGASRGSIELDAVDGDVLLVVSDDGRGFAGDGSGSVAGEGAGYGLFSIRERMALLGGALSLESDPAGTRATIRAPLEPDAKQLHSGAAHDPAKANRNDGVDRR